jgi:hypothetical protein
MMMKQHLKTTAWLQREQTLTPERPHIGFGTLESGFTSPITDGALEAVRFSLKKPIRNPPNAKLQNPTPDSQSVLDFRSWERGMGMRG